MNILIIGATRGIGFQLLEQTLKAGHTVTALVRDPTKLKIKNERLKVIKGDILDLYSVQQAMAEQDAVCSCIGVSLTLKPVTVFSHGTKNVLQAMALFRVKKLISVTGIGAGDSRGHGEFLYNKMASLPGANCQR